ncbi:hypothetical protein [Nitrospirillum viridazoti]|uniref:hypothetical protein n=1 Tax=Nitrospirillum viridazoti TaxID=3144925 RepID=UPI0011A053F9|nr:hypothetical protein [Nitrospirillum amazonense]
MSNQEHVQAEADPSPQARKNVNYVGLGAIIFIYMSIASFAATGVILIYVKSPATTSANILLEYFPPILLSSIGVFSAFVGVSLLHAAGTASITEPGLIVNKLEWNALSGAIIKGNEEAITQYVRLRSLGGFSGNFTKLGLTGLPLATIGLTLFFSIMFLHNAEYLELAKLTLGAFIGSFVQKQVSNQQGAGSVKLQSGETVKINPRPTTPL